MGRTKVSSKYQVVIPKDVRESAHIQVGQEFQVIAKGGSITLIPDRPISSMRASCGGCVRSVFEKRRIGCDRSRLFRMDRVLR
jgi:AbrB family looped-hinge helix DNA binding protein